MQEKDAVTIDYFEVPARFADLVNGYIYQGLQVVKAGDVRELNRSVLKLNTKKGKVQAQLVTADIVREVHHNMNVTLIFQENQSDVHYAMPVRVINEESSHYYKQWRTRAKQHEEEKDLQGAEFLSGFAKNDKLVPIITIVVYWGKAPWDGPRRLKEILDLEGYPLDVQKFIVDYPIHLLEVREYEHLEVFQTDIRYVFGFVQKENNKEQLQVYVKEHEGVFTRLASDAYDLISVMSHEDRFLERKSVYETKGGCNMCQAIEEMIEDGRTEGRLEGCVQMLRVVLGKIGTISEELEKKIVGEKDLNVLTIWCRKALEARDMQEFEDSI